MNKIKINIVTIIIIVMTFVIALFFPVTAQEDRTEPKPTPIPVATPNDRIAGAWKVEFVDPANNSEKEERILIFQRYNRTLSVEESLTEKETKGIITDDKVVFDSKVFLNGNVQKLSFVGDFIPNEGSLSGTATTANGSIEWSATKLSSLPDDLVFACSNHNPRHTATNKEEMKRLTKEYNCSGFSLL
jgi:hypothetical protein